MEEITKNFMLYKLLRNVKDDWEDKNVVKQQTDRKCYSWNMIPISWLEKILKMDKIEY